MTLGQMSMMGAAMVLAFALLRLAGGKHLPRRAFIWMWTAAAARFLLPIRVYSGWGVFSFSENLDGVAAGKGVVPIPPSGNGGAIVPVEQGNAIMVAPSVWPVIYIAGAVIISGYLLLLAWHWRKKFRRAVPVEAEVDYPLRRPLEIRELEGLRTPLTFGVLRPVIVLEAGQAAGEKEQLCCILTHEYVHIRRFDALRKLVFLAVAVMHWFNPAAWLLMRLASRDMELLCDELSLELLGEQRRKTYALTLLSAAERSAERIPLCSFFGKSMIEERILMMKEKKKLTAMSVMLAVVLLLGVTTAFATTGKNFPEQGTAEAVDETEHITVTGSVADTAEKTLVWPAEGCDKVSCPFGREHPITGVKTDHITIAGDQGANILAAAGGIISKSGWRNDWGNYLEIDHGDGLMSFYTHLQECFVEQGAAVEQGQIIAILGQSGDATGPCLGFYVSINGVCADPLSYFPE